MSVQVFDTASPQLKYWAETWPNFTAKAMKSLGWMMKTEINAGIDSGAPGGEKYAPLSGIRKGRRRGRLALKMESKERRPLGKLRRATGYQVKNNRLTVGWLSLSAVQIGTMMEQGINRPISQKMRKLFFASGLKPPKNDVKIPARRTIQPMRRLLEPKVGGYLEEKFMSYINGNTASSKPKSARKYVVAGSWGGM